MRALQSAISGEWKGAYEQQQQQPQLQPQQQQQNAQHQSHIHVARFVTANYDYTEKQKKRWPLRKKKQR